MFRRVRRRRDKEKFCDVHTSKSLLTMLSINEDLLIQIFDNQSSERRWKCWLYISQTSNSTVMALDQDNTQQNSLFSTISTASAPSLISLSLARSTTKYIYLYIPLWITEVRVYQPETDSAQILIYLKRMLSGVLSK